MCGSWLSHQTVYNDTQGLDNGRVENGIQEVKCGVFRLRSTRLWRRLPVELAKSDSIQSFGNDKTNFKMIGECMILHAHGLINLMDLWIKFGEEKDSMQRQQILIWRTRCGQMVMSHASRAKKVWRHLEMPLQHREIVPRFQHREFCNLVPALYNQ